MTRPFITARQAEVMRMIGHLTDARGHAPTIRELATALGIKSTNAVADHLRALRKKGMVSWEPRQSRTLKVVG